MGGQTTTWIRRDDRMVIFEVCLILFLAAIFGSAFNFEND